MARLSREHNDANVLALGARVVAPAYAREIVRVWLATAFEGGRHVRGSNRSRRSNEGARAMREYAADWEALKARTRRSRTRSPTSSSGSGPNLRLIASENYASPAVLAARLDDDEQVRRGLPRRYYGGCEFVDVTEQLAIDRAKELFGAEHANVQPHAGAQANMAVFGAFLEPNDPESKVLGMELAHGGTSPTGPR